MANEQNKFSQNNAAGAASPSLPQHSTGQSTGAATAPKKDVLTGAGGTFNTETGAAKSLLDQAKDTAGEAYNSVAATASTKLEEQKSSFSGGLSSVADSVRKVGSNLNESETESGIGKYTAEYSDMAAQKIEQVADYFDRKDAKAMYRDIESFARSNPAIFVGGAFALGLLAARFLKSSQPKQLSKAAGQSFGTERSVDEYTNGEAKTSPNKSSI